MCLTAARAALAQGRSAAIVLRYASFDAASARPLVAAWVCSALSNLGAKTLCESDLRRNGYGKPALAAVNGLWFNLSHCDSASLFAISRVGEIGCDIEDRLRADDLQRIGSITLHSSEQHWIESLASEEERSTAFARCWVRKEAVIKARGVGFGQDPRAVYTAPQSNKPKLRLEDGSTFIVHDAPLELRIEAAVACSTPDCGWSDVDLA